VLGAEACAWAPSFDATNFLTTVFPGAAAVAERLWSDSGVTSVDAARPRLHAWRCRLLARGLPTAPITGGVSTGAHGDAPPGAPTSFGGHCADGPWESLYAPPF
jgi:hexosaminidase